MCLNSISRWIVMLQSRDLQDRILCSIIKRSTGRMIITLDNMALVYNGDLLKGQNWLRLLLDFILDIPLGTIHWEFSIHAHVQSDNGCDITTLNNCNHLDLLWKKINSSWRDCFIFSILPIISLVFIRIFSILLWFYL